MILTACGPSPTRPPETSAPAGPPVDGTAFELQPADAWLRVRVYRDGPLAALGHNHVISASAVKGRVYFGDDVTRARLDLEIPVAALEVDRPELRAEAGEAFAAPLDRAAIEGTRANMLGEKLLDAERFPAIRIASREISGQLPDLRMLLAITVRGQEYEVSVPVTVALNGSVLLAEGEFQLRHSDLGLTPFSVMLGALTVRDAMDVRFRLTAQAD